MESRIIVVKTYIHMYIFLHYTPTIIETSCFGPILSGSSVTIL